MDWRPYVMPLLAHPSPEVRTMAVRHLGRAVPAPDNTYTDHLTALFDDEETGYGPGDEVVKDLSRQGR